MLPLIFEEITSTPCIDAITAEVVKKETTPCNDVAPTELIQEEFSCYNEAPSMKTKTHHVMVQSQQIHLLSSTGQIY